MDAPLAHIPLQMPVLYVCRSGKSHPPLQDALSRHRSLTLSRIRARKRLCERVGSSIWSNSADSSDRSGPLGSNVNANSPQERPSRFLWGKLPWPNQLLGPKSIEKGNKTVYTIRLKTANGRGAGVSEVGAGVFLGLVSAQGKMFLTLLSPLNDPAATEAELRHICQVADESTGANCQLALRSLASTISTEAHLKPRFQAGSIDEVSLLGPDLGHLAGLLIGPQTGRWHLDEVIISSSSTGYIDRFICREALGQQAAYLSPLPAGSVVYGSGAQLVILTQEQAAAQYARSMSDYDALKGHLTATNAALVVAGTALVTIAGDWDAATPFAVGGAAGLLYQVLLQSSVDAIAGRRISHTYHTASPSRLTSAMSSGYSRFTLVVLVALVSIYALDVSVSSDRFNSAQTTITFFTGAAGFLMWKVAVMCISVWPLFRRNGDNSPPPSSKVSAN